jgi:Holliday junction resolvase RusA-like endonuclease
MQISFFVPGVPAPGGSKRYLGHRGGKAILVDTCKRNKDWRSVVAMCAKEAMQCADPIDCALEVEMYFNMPRPKYHYDSKGLVKDKFLNAPHVIKPDVLKLARSTEDAMTGIVYRDDSQTVSLKAVKFYDMKAGCLIVVKGLA